MLGRCSRIIAVAVVALALCSNAAHALNIQGKWGLGAPIFVTRGTTEISLIHGASNGALGLDFIYAFHQNRADEFGGNPVTSEFTEQTSLTLGPRLRRFMLSDPTFSPYFDIFLHVVQSQLLQTGGVNTRDTRGWGGEGGIGLGLEYLTPWHFSLAGHSDVATVTYVKFTDHDNVLGSRDRTQFQSVGGFSAQLVARGYF